MQKKSDGYKKEQLTSTMIELHVPNFEVVKKFYIPLEFEIIWEREPQGDNSGYLVLRKEKVVLNFHGGTDKVYKHKYFGKYPKETKRGYGVEIVIPLEDVISFYKHVQEQKPNCIVQKLGTKYYFPDFRIEDPFGYYLRFVEKYNWVDTRNPDGTPNV